MPFPLAAAVVGGTARKAVGGAVKKAGRWLAGRLFGSKGRRAAGAAIDVAAGGVAAAGATSIITRVTGGMGGPPGLPPTGSFGPGGQYPRPREGVVGRTVSRMLPGGLTGYEGVALDGTEYDKYGRPIAVGVEMRERAYAPPGYVIVQTEDGPIAMLKGAARAMGLWQGKPKPPVSGWDMRAIGRAARAKKRVRKLGSKVGLKLSAK